MNFKQYLTENGLGVRADACCLKNKLCDKAGVIYKSLMAALDNDENLVFDVMRKLDIETDNYVPLALGRSSAEELPKTDSCPNCEDSDQVVVVTTEEE